jgi:leader peptidase (prepilin peptidase)/N-methyltransferase
MKCNYQLKWYDLVPVFSYLFLLGRCRKCKTKISIQYPIIEALNGLLYVLVFYINGWDSLADILLSTVYCLVLSALFVLSVIDFRTKTIPFGINIVILIMGLIAVTVQFFGYGRHIEVIIRHVAGLLVVSGFLMLVFYATKGRGIGGGDIKLMAAAGLVLGWDRIILAFFLGCIIASVIHPIRMKISHLNRELAFGPYLSVGIAIALLFGNQMIDWYLQLLVV